MDMCFSGLSGQANLATADGSWTSSRLSFWEWRWLNPKPVAFMMTRTLILVNPDANSIQDP
ncbi:hypothetical protein HJFPF1_10015 [Paramyrothecium foliicola]|nr:hypothetical protein HJFPF1_10015 [Paramyrothecium foliicola]